MSVVMNMAGSAHAKQAAPTRHGLLSLDSSRPKRSREVREKERNVVDPHRQGASFNSFLPSPSSRHRNKSGYLKRLFF